MHKPPSKINRKGSCEGRGKDEGQGVGAIRHGREALERTPSIFPSISEHAGPSTTSLKKKEDASLFIYHKDTWLTASCKQAVCLCMCLRSPCARSSFCQRYQFE